MNLEILTAELTADPENIGYAGKTDRQAADLMNVVNRPRGRASMSGDEVFQNIESQAVWDLLTPEQRNEFLTLCARDSIDPFGPANVALVTSIFGGGSATVTNLQTARVETVSRGVELGLGRVGEGDVWDVRNG